MGYELYHSAKGSGWKNHKYTSKITKNGKTYYVYGNKGPSKSGDSKGGFLDWFGTDEADEMTKAAFKAGSAKESYENAVKKKQSEKDVSKARAKYYAANMDYEKKKEAYYKTPMGTIEVMGTAAAKAAKKGAKWAVKKTKQIVSQIKSRSQSTKVASHGRPKHMVGDTTTKSSKHGHTKHMVKNNRSGLKIDKNTKTSTFKVTKNRSGLTMDKNRKITPIKLTDDSDTSNKLKKYFQSR